MLRRARTYVLAGAAAAALLCVPANAPAAALETVLQDDAQLLHRPDEQLLRSLRELKLLGVDRLRVTAGWSVLTREPDSETRPAFDATDPAAYEQDRWRNLDRLVVLAQEHGFKTMIDIAFWAPHWASQDKPGQRGRTEVDPEHFRQFAVAVARRYSGTYVVSRALGGGAEPLAVGRDQRFLAENYGTSNPAGTTSLTDVLGVRSWLAPDPAQEALETTLGADPTRPLPKVDLFTLWNEPNHTGFLRPQWTRQGDRNVPRSPHMYREMVRRAYPSIKGVRPDAAVLIGGTSAEGSHSGRGTGNVPPLRFLRELACVDGRFRPLKRSGCAGFAGVPGDGWAHHPYTMQTPPGARARQPDDVPMAELPKLARQIERLIKAGRLAPAVRNLWVTEYGYETNPPVPDGIWSISDQARFLTWAEFLASRVPTNRSYAQFLLRDLPPGAFRVGKSRRRAFGQWQSGLEHADGTPKGSVYSFRAGLFVQRLDGERLRFWGRLRLGDGITTLAIDRRALGTTRWRTIFTAGPGDAAADRFTVAGRESFHRFGTAPDGAGYRYRLRYLDGLTWHAGMPVQAVR